MSTERWFREFERDEAKRQDRIDQIRADRKKPARYEARVPDVRDSRWGVFDRSTQQFCVGEIYATPTDAMRAAERLNTAYIRATEP